MRTVSAILFGILLVSPLLAPRVQAGVRDPGFGTVGVNGDVIAMIADGDNVYMGGVFDLAGGTRGGTVARWNESRNEWTPLLVGSHGFVTGMALVDGNLYVGGGFLIPTQEGMAANLARYDLHDGTWHSVGISPGSEVLAVLAGEGCVYIGGSFRSVGGIEAWYVARWNLATETWHAMPGLNDRVVSLASSDGRLYASGFFSSAGGRYAYGPAEWDTATESWVPLGTEVGNSSKLAVAPDGNLLSLGFRGLLEWDENARTWTDTGCPETGYYLFGEVLIHPDGRILVIRSGVWAWDGTSWSLVANGSDCATTAALMGRKLFVGGCFSSIEGVVATGVARLDLDEARWSALDDGRGHGMANPVITMETHGGKAYAGGRFRTAGDLPANCVAAWDGAEWETFGGGITDEDGLVWAVEALDNDVYVGGIFNEAGGKPAGNVARWDRAADQWDVLEGGVSEANVVEIGVWDVHAVGNEVYVAGDFMKAGDVPAASVARWDGGSRTWSSLGTGAANGVDGWIDAMAFYQNRLYVGGAFHRIGDLPSSRPHTMAYWDLNTLDWHYLDNGEDDDVSGAVWSFERRGSRLYVCGDFNRAGGYAASNFAVYDLNEHAWTVPSGGVLREPVYGTIADMTWLGDDLVVSGLFRRLQDGRSAAGIAVWNPTTGWAPFSQEVEPLSGHAEPEVYHVVGFRGGLLVGGAFSAIGDKAALNVGWWTRDQGNLASSAVDRVRPLPLRLAQNRPNPARASTAIGFHVPRAGTVRLTVLDISGRTVAKLLDRNLAAGDHELVWNGASGGQRLADGVYFYRLQTPAGTTTRKLVLVSP